MIQILSALFGCGDLGPDARIASWSFDTNLCTPDRRAPTLDDLLPDVPVDAVALMSCHPHCIVLAQSGLPCLHAADKERERCEIDWARVPPPGGWAAKPGDRDAAPAPLWDRHVIMFSRAARTEYIMDYSSLVSFLGEIDGLSEAALLVMHGPSGWYSDPWQIDCTRTNGRAARTHLELLVWRIDEWDKDGLGWTIRQAVVGVDSTGNVSELVSASRHQSVVDFLDRDAVKSE